MILCVKSYQINFASIHYTIWQNRLLKVKLFIYRLKFYRPAAACGMLHYNTHMRNHKNANYKYTLLGELQRKFQAS